ncbi:MAG: GFA family protein [Hyphomonadaceae bacterium]|nr:GFA family protein [Hyphomonadaceae bacterium]
MTDIIRKGRCLCGAVRFETRGEPHFISNCHCESCRRAASAPSVVWAGFFDTQVTFSGEAPAEFASSPGVRRSFCSRCGSPLAYRGDRWSGETHLPVCAFEQPESLPPQSDHLEAEKLPWAALLAP